MNTFNFDKKEEPDHSDLMEPVYEVRIGDFDEVTMKCTSENCDKEVTLHYWSQIQPIASEDEELDPALRRRLIMCTQCGKLSLKK